MARDKIIASILGSSSLLWSGAAYGQTGAAERPHVVSYATPETPAVSSLTGSETSEDIGTGDIVVTGSRLRAEAVQAAPIAVSVTSAKQVEALHASDLRGLTSIVPNLYVAQLPNNPGGPLIFMRGFGAASNDPSVEPGIAVYVDGIYQTIQAGGLSDVLDIDKIEVLRGPQSTLLGKNASAGGVLVTRSRPTGELGAKVQAEYGRYNLVQVQALFNAPIIKDVLAFKLYGSYRDRDGYAVNLAGGHAGAERTKSVRAAFLFTPTENFKLYVSGSYQWFEPEPGPSRYVNPTPLTSPACTIRGFCTNLVDEARVVNLDFVKRARNRNRDAVANAEWNLEPIKITSITGYRHFNSNNNSDTDATPVLVTHSISTTQNSHDFSQELRINSQEDGPLSLGGRFHWMLGGYYSDARVSANAPNASLSAPCGTSACATIRTINQAQRVVRNGRALFAQADFDIFEQLTASFGIRRSYDKTRHDFSLPTPGPLGAFPGLPYTQSAKFRNTSFEGGVRYKIDATKMIYFRYAEGYRGGGFIGAPATLLQSSVGFQPETSQSYEIGVKTEFFDRKLLFNLTGFSTDYAGLLRTVSVPVATPPFFVSTTSNAAQARIRGIELESVLRPWAGFQISVSGGYLDPQYKEYTSGALDLRAQPFPFTAKWTGSVIPSYDILLPDGGTFSKINLQAKLDYRGRAYVSPAYFADGTPVPQLFQSRYATVDLQASLTGGRDDWFDLNLYVQNVGNKNYVSFGARVGTVPTTLYVVDNPGRIWGISATVRY